MLLGGASASARRSGGSRSSWRGAGATLLALLAVLIADRPATAKDSATEAEPLIRQGLNLRHQNRDELALPYFQKAYELVRTPRTEGQLGLVEMALGYWLDADQHLSEVLKVGDHPWVTKNRKSLEDALTRVRRNIGEVTVEAVPAGADIIVNGRTVGTAPLAQAIRAPKGRLEIEVRAVGFQSSTSYVQVEGGDRKRAVVTLAKEEPRAPDPSHTLASSPPADQVSRGPEPRQPVVDRPAGGARRKVALVTGIAAGVALAAAVTETVIWQVKRQGFESHRGPPPDNPTLPEPEWQRDCGVTDAGRGSPACRTLYDASRKAQTYALIGYAVGGALAVTSGVLFLTARRSRSDDEARVACVPELLDRGFSCRLTF